MDRLISPALEGNAYSYLDDIIVVTATFEGHMKYLEVVLRRMKGAGLTINRGNSVFCREEVKYLGFLVNHGGFRPDPEKTVAVREYPAPKNIKQLRRFMGMASWYRKFLPNYVMRTEPFTSLTKKGHKYEWGEEQPEACDAIKAFIVSAPILHRPHLEAQFVVQKDARDTGLGAVLLQTIDGAEHALEFASLTMIPAERNYTVNERGCLALVWAVRKFRPYIEGYNFKVVTDHSSLRWLCNLRNPTGRSARWALELQGHSFTVDFLGQRDNRRMLSRAPTKGVALYYYWAVMCRDVEAYMFQCLIYHQRKVEKRAPAGFMGKHIVTRLWQMISSGIIGPLIYSSFSTCLRAGLHTLQYGTPT